MNFEKELLRTNKTNIITYSKNFGDINTDYDECNE